MKHRLTEIERSPAVVALGGGHGLANSLRALRRITTNLTAVVGVADDGGSSGRLRAEFGVLPPGDLRMALAALCADDMWGQTWSRVIQHRFEGHGELAGHSLGNLLMTALWQEAEETVAGLNWMAALLEAHGTVLPCSTTPLDIHARTVSGDEIIGQVNVALAHESLVDVWIEPSNPDPCRQALESIEEADVIVLGPGSWFTSVIPHLLIEEQRKALERSRAVRILISNVQPNQDRETLGMSIADHVQLIRHYAPDLRFDIVIADPAHVDDVHVLQAASADMGAVLQLSPVEARGAEGHHDPDLLSIALRTAMVPK
jgi:uncharacterized cofD-like protein